jgi:hypothetical protein
MRLSGTCVGRCDRRALIGLSPLRQIAGLTVLETNQSAIDVQLLEHELSRSDSRNFMKDPADAAQMIARMCAPQRSERYASLDEVLDDLAIVEAQDLQVVPGRQLD